MEQCLRSPDEFEPIDVSLSAYRALRIIAAAGQQNATLTLPQACDLVRGLGKGAFATQENKGKGKGSVDVAKVAGDKVTGLDKDGVEALLMRLLLDGYIAESFHASEFLEPGPATTGPGHSIFCQANGCTESHSCVQYDRVLVRLEPRVPIHTPRSRHGRARWRPRHLEHDHAQTSWSRSKVESESESTMYWWDQTQGRDHRACDVSHGQEQAGQDEGAAVDCGDDRARRR